MPTVCVSVLLLIRLRLQQTTLHQLTKFLPTSYLILRSLYRVQTVQVVHRHAQRLTKRNVRWRQHSRVLHSAVHGKLNQRKGLHPILALVRKCSHNLLNSTILPLSLTVSLRVISTTENSSRTKQTPQRLPKGRCKTYVTVVNNIPRYTKEPNPIIEKQLRHLRCSQLAFPRPAGY